LTLLGFILTVLYLCYTMSVKKKEKGLSDVELIKKYGSKKKVNLDKIIKKAGASIKEGGSLKVTPPTLKP
jgi:hypothetical protein